MTAPVNCEPGRKMCFDGRGALLFVFVCVLVPGSNCDTILSLPSPCPRVFQYMLDSNGILYGRIEVLYRAPINVIQLLVEMSVGNPVQGYNGKIQLINDNAKAIYDRIVNGRPLYYKVHFPFWVGTPPKVTKILINGEQICAGPPIIRDKNTLAVLTTINLSHKLTLNLSPLSAANIPDVSFDTIFDTQPGVNVYNIGPDQNTNGFVQPDVNFSPQPKAPVFPSNPFSNSVTTVGSVDVRYYSTTSPNANTRATTEAYPKIGTRATLNEVCGKSLAINSLIANGKPAIRGHYPWLAAIYTIKSLGIEFSCGGSLISTKHVVTAAHCMKRNDKKLSIDKVLVILGRSNIQGWNNGVLRESLLLNAFEIHIHPDHKPMSADADIAVITVEKEVQFTKYIKPICLWSEETDLNAITGLKGVVVGWGKDENGVFTSHEPRQISLPVVSQEECIRSHDTFQDITSERTFCAGYRNGSGPCNGDSGGGFIMQRFGRWTLRGLVSTSISDHAKNCDLSQYVVFTDVSKFSDWLLPFLG